MEEISTKIGDHFFKFICDSKKIINIIKKNFQINNAYGMLQPDLIIELKDGFGIPFKDFEVQIIKKHNKVIYQRADYLIEIDSDYKNALVSVFDELAFKHALMNLYSSFIVHQEWGLLIHSSCVIENERAHIFAGKSGAGKSTAAKLSYPRPLLSDEASIIKITPTEVTVYNSPFRSELEAQKNQTSIKLESIQILFQAIKNNRVKITTADAFIHIFDKIFYWPYSQDEIKTIIELLKILVKNIPIYELHFEKNNTFWKLIS